MTRYYWKCLVSVESWNLCDFGVLHIKSFENLLSQFFVIDGSWDVVETETRRRHKHVWVFQLLSFGHLKLQTKISVYLILLNAICVMFVYNPEPLIVCLDQLWIALQLIWSPDVSLKIQKPQFVHEELCTSRYEARTALSGQPQVASGRLVLVFRRFLLVFSQFLSSSAFHRHTDQQTTVRQFNSLRTIQGQFILLKY